MSLIHEAEPDLIHYHKACTIDILMHLPRSAFSQLQLNILLWHLEVNDVPHLPSPQSLRNLEVVMQRLHGVRTLAYDGALGHKYYINLLSDIIAQASEAIPDKYCFNFASGNGKPSGSSTPAVLSRRHG
jgi:hypothetical protein